MPKWKARGSALGHYASCLYRAAFDRAIAEQIANFTPEELAAISAKKQSSPYADLGTCIHWHLQQGLRCRMPPTATPPTPEQEINASALFKNDLGRTRQAIRESAIFAARHMPALPAGEVWDAEVAVTTRYYTGHIDFVHAGSGYIVDLKTTSRPPLTAYAKPAHLIQLLAYVDAIEQAAGYPPTLVLHHGVVLYVDAQSAGWALPVPIDLRDPAIIEYREQVRALAALLTGKQL